MIQQLKKKMMPGKLVPALLLLAAALALTAYLSRSIALLIQGPQDLYDLSMDELEGAYVEADVDMLIDWYAETVQSKEGSPDKTTHREYLMPVKDAIIGLEIPAFLMSDAEKVMDNTINYLSYDSYTPDGSVVTVKGTIQRMDEETEGFFYNVLEDYGMTEADKETCPPLVLRYGTVGPLEPGLHNVLLIVDGILLLLAVIIFIQAMAGSGLKQIKAYCAALPDSQDAAEQLETFYNETPEEDGLRLDRRWLLYAKGSEAFLLATSDVAWIYLTTTTHRVNGIPTGKTYAVTVCSMSERKKQRRHSIPVKSEEAGRELIQKLYRYIPDALYGYDAKWTRPYDADPAGFYRQQMEQRRAAQAAAAAAAAQAEAASAQAEPAAPLYTQNSGNE